MIGTLSKVGFGEFKTIECGERKYDKRYMRKKTLQWMGFQNEQRKAAAVGGEAPVKRLKTDGGEFLEKVKPQDSEEYYLSFAMGPERQGKWHTGYLTYCTKFF